MDYKYKAPPAISTNTYNDFSYRLSFLSFDDVDRIYQDIKSGYRPSSKTFCGNFDYIIKELKGIMEYPIDFISIISRANNKNWLFVFEYNIYCLAYKLLSDYLSFALNETFNSVPRVHYDRYLKIPFEKFVRL